MATTYYLKVHVESAGTGYTGGGTSKSLAGHMWYEIYQKDGNGTISNPQNSGYTGHGITNDDGKNYAGKSAYSSNEVPLTQEQFNTLNEFGKHDSPLATQNGFGPDDYNVLNNSCIDYAWKALELAGFNSSEFQGDLVPMWNKNEIEELFNNNPERWQELSYEEKQALEKYGLIPYDPSSLSDPDLTYDPHKLTPITPDSDIDHDGIPDWMDPDMDGDGLPDAEDSDRDGDGIPDAVDPDPLTPEPNPDDGHPFDPQTFDPPRRSDPLVLDLNQDGLISTVSLADSTAFFDLTGDGIKEKVGWVQASEGIVVLDKNGNGKIDGIGEVFGTATTSGFTELRQLADSNYDGVIDRRDELYSQLKVWQDVNQDGISQANELKSLSQAGVTKIELDVFATNINLNGNLLSEAGRYGSSDGTRSLAADVELTFDARITTVDTSLIPDYTVHPQSLTLPSLRGYGTVYNTQVAYNVNDTLRNLAMGMSQDITAVAKNFDNFIAEWSGLNTMFQNVQTANNQNYKNGKKVIKWNKI